MLYYNFASVRTPPLKEIVSVLLVEILKSHSSVILFSLYVGIVPARNRRFKVCCFKFVLRDAALVSSPIGYTFSVLVWDR